MLALTRKKDEAIIVNDNIEIKIIDIVGDKVRIGISAPKEVSIYREEVYLQVLESNRKASGVQIEVLADIKNLLSKQK